MTDFSEIKQILDVQNDSWQDFKKSNDSRLKTLESELGSVLKKQGRVGAGAGDNVFAAPKRDVPQFIDTKTRERVPVLEHKDKLSQNSDVSLGRILRGMVMQGHADDAKQLADERKSLSIFDDSSGGYTVGGELSSQWIDHLRAASVLSQAGVLTVPMSSKTLSIAKVTADAATSWHAENASLTAVQPTFGATNLDAKTITCLVKMSLELSQDSANLEKILETTLTNSLAAAIDAAGLNGSTTNAAAAPVGIINQADNDVAAIGAPTDWGFLADAMYQLLADNVLMTDIGAMIAHPSLWKKMVKLKSGLTNDNTPLALHPEIAGIKKLWTTSAPFALGTTTTAIVGNWRDLVFGIRKDISVRVLSESYLGSNLQVAVLAYARCDFAPTRTQSFCTMSGITVA